MQRDERPEEYLREKERLVAIISRLLSSVILSAGSSPRNLFRIITTPWCDYPLKCYFVNDIFTVIGDICDERFVRLLLFAGIFHGNKTST